LRELSDTIVAPITGAHPAPVAVVRLSGPDAWRVAAGVFRPWPGAPEPRKAVFGKVCGTDEGLALPFDEGRSYTGEQTVEISMHGSRASVNRLIEACLRAGARFAEPGEFTLRAFLNGRMDLTQAEGVRDTIAAKTDAQLRQAALHRSGALNREVSALRETIGGVLAAVEASADFSEEVGELDREAASARLSEARERLDKLIASANAGRLLREGIRVVIAGRPNAGKSSLLNTLVGMERAIVTDVPGTTRDYVEEQIERNGMLWVFVDTAGLRESADEVESIGVRRARELTSSADVVWYLYDASEGWDREDEQNCSGISAPLLRIANKSDIAPDPGERLSLCAISGEGIAELFAETARALELSLLDGELLVNARHAPLLERAKDALVSAVDALHAPVPDDLAAVGLYACLKALGEVTGEDAQADVLESVFRDFCIGK